MKRLFEQFQPEHYAIYLEPDREKTVFFGRVTITGRKTGRPSHRISLHAKGLKIKSAKITRHDKKNGSSELVIDRINSQRSFDELRLHTVERLIPGNYTIEIEFTGKITEPMHGIYPCNFMLDGKNKQLIATQFESHHAREAFPCVDEPAAKATFDLELLTPAGESVISNTPIKIQAEKNKKLLTSFDSTPRMSTYLLAFAYGELSYKESKTKNGVIVRVWATPDKIELTDFALDVGVRSLEYFEDYYGVPYPLPKLDLIGLPDFSAGAMENWGLITFRESVLYVNPKSTAIDTKQYVAMVIAHEIAHQWFGNLVTMKWWNDLWLNESFANMMEYLAVDKLFPQWKIWQIFAQRELSSALSRDALPNVQPLQVEVNHPDELASVFDPSIVYAKGGSLLNMVRGLIGEASFRKALNTYFEEFKYQNTQADDLWRHLEAASGIKISDIMHDWLKRPGYPVVEVDHESFGKTFQATQHRLTLGPSENSKPNPWAVPLAASLALDKSILERKKDNFTIINKTGYPLTLNHEGKSYLVTQYMNPKHLESILAAVKDNILSPIDRLLFIQNYLLLERAGRVSTLQNIQMLPVFVNERNEAVWSMLAGIIGNARILIDTDQDLEHNINAFIRPLAAPLVSELGWQSADNDSAQTQKLRALALSLAAAAEDEKVIKHGLGLFSSFKRPHDLRPDIRSVVYFVGVRYGSKSDFEKLISLHNNSVNADEKDEIAGDLTATRDKEKIKQLLSMIHGPHVRLQDVSTWFGWLMRNRYATDLTWKWLIDKWEWIDKKFGDDKSYDRFPRYAAMVFSKTEQLEDFKAFFEPKLNIALSRPVKLGIEEIVSRIAWRKSNEQAVKDWARRLKL